MILVSQQPIPVIYQNVMWNGYTGPNAGKYGGNNIWLQASDTPSYPFPNFTPDGNFLPMTFYGGDGDTNAIGIQRSQYLLNGIQGGNTVGMLLAPRSIQPDMSQAIYYALLAAYWFPTTAYPRPWQNGSSLKMEINAVFPFVYVPQVGFGATFSQGTAFCYFTAFVISVRNNNRAIYICPRLLQNQYPQGDDENTPLEWDFGPGDQISYDSVHNTAILYPELGPSSRWITSLGNGSFNIGSNPYMKYYAFTMSPAQFTQAIADINSSERVPENDYDPDPSAWIMVIFNLNCEAWAPSGADPRFGLSFNGFTVSLI